jgi:hypothetical protein
VRERELPTTHVFDSRRLPKTIVVGIVHSLNTIFQSEFEPARSSIVQ